MDNEEHFLRRAMRLAMEGRGRVEPNPMVGCVIVKDGRVIGQGIHARFGGPHAEPTALAACTESPAGATAYVTLEPCCHLNKKTPPCVPKLIEAKIARVVVGCLDPNPDVNGKGLKQLREAGIEVVGPMLEGEARQLLAPFIGKTVFHRPYLTMKWAESADGKIAGTGGKRMQISNAASSALVQTLRSRCDAILIGSGTAIADDPLLTARVEGESRLVTRIVLDSRLRLPLASQLVKTANDLDVELYFTRDGFAAADPAHIKALLAAGVHLKETAADDRGHIALPPFLQSNRLADVTHLLVEPGPTLARSFFDAGGVDRLWVFRSPSAINDATAPAASKIPSRFVKTGELNLAGDVLTEFLDQESDLFFAAEPSADFLLATESLH
jgi:diaminohydroxyphosphoribosylaminopyrimidine deaminase/5-amino-6-(5-phosphoribosylamino)uracil reductase